MTQVRKVVSKKELADFIDFPHTLYEGDVNYVPELYIGQRDLFTPGKHPFHEHSNLQLFLAYDGKEIKGRIGAIQHNNHNASNNNTDGFFGFFDVVNDEGVARLLINEASKWLAEKGLTNMIGPFNHSTNEACGVLVDGFDSPPVAMMPFNKHYYAGLLEACGFKKNVDLLAYQLPTLTTDKRTVQLKDVLIKRLQLKGITIRKINLKNFDEEVDKVLSVYNKSWEENTGFVPMTDKEFRYLAKDLKMILDKDFASLAEHNGKVVGFALAIPDVNQILKTIKRGRLFPTGIFKLLFGLKKIDFVRVLALGVEPEYRRLGIEACFYADIIEQCIAKNIKGGEASLILEDNEMMNNGLIKLNGTAYKRYRVYEKEV